MPSADDRIVCRDCGELVSIDAGACSRCGTRVRGRKGPIGLIVVGGLLALFGARGGGWLHLVVGVLVAVGGGYLLYEQRRRIEQAGEQAEGQAGEQAEGQAGEQTEVQAGEQTEVQAGEQAG